MKVMRLGVLSGFAFILVYHIAKALEVGPPPEDRGTREAMFRFAYVASVVQSGIEMYAIDRGEYPRSLKELCEGPYLPVSCDTLKNPYTGEPLSGSNKPGDITFEGGGEKITLTLHIRPGLDFVSLLDNPRRFLSCALPDTGEVLASCPALEEYRGLDMASKRAYAVGRYLLRQVSFFHSAEQRAYYKDTGQEVQPPNSLEEFRAKIRSYRDEWVNAGTVHSRKNGAGFAMGGYWVEWENLLNDFGKGPAREVNTPSPGNFRYYKDPDPTSKQWYIEAYGTGGKVVFREPIY